MPGHHGCDRCDRLGGIDRRLGSIERGSQQRPPAPQYRPARRPRPRRHRALGGIDGRLGGHLREGGLARPHRTTRPLPRGSPGVASSAATCPPGCVSAVLDDVTSRVSGADASASGVGSDCPAGGLALLRFGQVLASPRMVRLPPRGRQSPGRTPGLPVSAGRPCGWWARQTPPFRGARGSAFLLAVPA